MNDKRYYTILLIACIAFIGGFTLGKMSNKEVKCDRVIFYEDSSANCIIGIRSSDN